MLAFNRQRYRPGKAGSQGLCATHATQASSQNPAPGQRTTKMLTTCFSKRLVRALHNALAANVDPATRRHLSVHEQTGLIQLVKLLPRGPFRDQIRIGQQHARCITMRTEHPHRLAGLNQQSLVIFQLTQAGQNLVVALPVPGRTPDAAVHHQMLGILGHGRVQIVLNHAVRGFRHPVLATELCPRRGMNLPRRIETGILAGRRSVMIRHDAVLHLRCLWIRAGSIWQAVSTRGRQVQAPTKQRFSCKLMPMYSHFSKLSIHIKESLAQARGCKHGKASPAAWCTTSDLACARLFCVRTRPTGKHKNGCPPDESFVN